ncbi:O-antigen polymerase [Metabacillus halosaccharovorans]|uniref:Oligosaccharide repeat unit polymerase n=1 Tax=Metabacillus halosaccharovorans TaxID=930124 RepID=A0ABT3DCI2_9BACI|nr:O-antigen polymerase [Metabacillus halosaccharovorans]MCV9884694.1 oligosaccharide repeat unit polymerase [Metabacillus halosaccharovorans]
MQFDFTSILFFTLWGFVVFSFLFWFAYLYTKRKLITITSTTILMKIFIPLIIMYPFAFSDKNAKATGSMNYRLYLEEINATFVICLIGTVFFILGCYASSQIRVKNPLINSFTFAFNSYLNKMNIFLYFFVLLGIFLFMYRLGFFQTFLDGRSFGMANESLRPIANLFYSLCTFFIVITLTYYNQTKLLPILLLTIIVGLFLTTSGTRGGLLWTLVMFFFIYYNLYFDDKKKANYSKLFIKGILVLFVAIYVGDARTGQYNLIVSITNTFEKVFYGNNFSDLRDFSWVMAYWNQEFLHGKTMLSGYLAFIPSAIFPFREQWSLGYFTVSTVGFDPSVHPGLRPGIFGESFFNFGILGVCSIGFIMGFIINSISRYVQNVLYQGTSKKDAIIVVSAGYILADLMMNFMITAGFFKVYVVLGLIFVGYVFYRLTKGGKKPGFKKYKITW